MAENLYAWGDNVPFSKFFFFLDSEHVCCVHKTSRNPPPGHQRERHERLALRLQPSAGWNDKVPAKSWSWRVLDLRESQSSLCELPLPTDPSWRGGAAAYRRTDRAAQRKARRPCLAEHLWTCQVLTLINHCDSWQFSLVSRAVA